MERLDAALIALPTAAFRLMPAPGQNQKLESEVKRMWHKGAWDRV